MKFIDWSQLLRGEMLYICTRFLQGGKNDFRQTLAAIVGFYGLVNAILHIFFLGSA